MSSLEYDISGNGNQVLQVVINPNERVYADCNTVCWSSENIKIRRDDSTLSVLMGSRTDGINIMNISSTPAFVGLSQQQGGPIFVLDFKNSVTTGVYCFKESFICASVDTNVVTKKLPFGASTKTSYGVTSQRRFQTRHCTVNRSSLIFLQNGADIMSKNLCAGETMLVNMWCCVAIEDTCNINLHQIHQLYFGGFFAKEGIMIKVEGPGRVYFSGNKESSLSNGLTHSNGLSKSGSSSSISLFLNLAAMLLTLYLILLLTTNIFIDNDLLDELEKQLDKQLQAARERANGEEL
jgi:uncharacterized protein (AIM24 family)